VVSLRAVTLDAAGTLFEVAEPVGMTYARAAGRHGIVVDARRVDAAWRAAMAAAPPLAFPGAAADAVQAGERAWWRSVVRAALGGPGAEACFDELFAHYGAAAAWRVFPDVPEALRQLRSDGLRLVVVSNFDHRLHGVLAGLGLLPLLDAVMPSTAVGWAKPDPRIFVAACRAVGATPLASLHVGDDLRADVAGALAAGQRAVLVDRRGQRPDLPPGATAIESLEALPDLVRHFPS
jgi:putative hydrolase of the HAD superfamily